MDKFVICPPAVMETLKKLLLLLFPILIGFQGLAQACPEPEFPGEGQTVPVDITISWTEVVGVAAYLIQLGTTEGGSEITPRTSTGQSTRFTPPQGLPENSTVYVEIYVFNTLTNSSTLCAKYSFRTDFFPSVPGCSELLNPTNGAINVPIQTDISWQYTSFAEEYLVSIGLTEGGSELLNPEVIDALTISPSDYLGDNLPANSEIYIRIIPQNNLGLATGCNDFKFTTGPENTLPECGSIIYPPDLDFDVPLSPIISWNAVEGAESYLISIGTSPFENDILSNAVFNDRDPNTDELITETGIINFEPNRQYFITITPRNTAGEAQNCRQTTFFTSVGCGPYFDVAGNLIDLTPELNFPESVGICPNGGDSTIRVTDPADGYRWFQVINPNREELLAEGPEFVPPGPGEYRIEIYDEFPDPISGTLECANSQLFTVSQSERAIIEATDVRLGVGVISIEVEVSGIGDYEFALDNPDGPYQDSNRFTNLPIDNYRVYVRDKKGCGISDILVEPDLTLEGFPKFFTPNGDGINDLWQFILPPSGINPIREL
ncbi:MAG: hypothetical protein P8X60_05960 [Robiginitalea sp.]